MSPRPGRHGRPGWISARDRRLIRQVEGVESRIVQQQAGLGRRTSAAQIAAAACSQPEHARRPMRSSEATTRSITLAQLAASEDGHERL